MTPTTGGHTHPGAAPTPTESCNADRAAENRRRGYGSADWCEIFGSIAHFALKSVS